MKYPLIFAVTILLSLCLNGTSFPMGSDDYDSDDDDADSHNPYNLSPMGRGMFGRFRRTRKTTTTTTTTTTSRTTRTRPPTTTTTTKVPSSPQAFKIDVEVPDEPILKTAAVNAVMQSVADSLIEEEFKYELMRLKEKTYKNSTENDGTTTAPVARSRQMLVGQQNDSAVDMMTNWLSKIENMTKSVSLEVLSKQRDNKVIASARTMVDECGVANVQRLACELMRMQTAGSLVLLPFSTENPLLSDTRDSPLLLISEACLDPNSIYNRRKVNPCKLYKILQNIALVSEQLATTASPTTTTRATTTRPVIGFARAMFAVSNSASASLPVAERRPTIVNGLNLDDGADDGDVEFICGANNGQFDRCQEFEQSCEAAFRVTTATPAPTTTTSKVVNWFRWGPNNYANVGTTLSPAAVTSEDSSTNLKMMKCKVDQPVIPSPAGFAASGRGMGVPTVPTDPFSGLNADTIEKIQQNIQNRYKTMQKKLQKYLNSTIDHDSKANKTYGSEMNPDAAISVVHRVSYEHRPVITPSRPKADINVKTGLQGQLLERGRRQAFRTTTTTTRTTRTSTRPTTTTTTTRTTTTTTAYVEPGLECSVEVQALAQTLLDMNNNGSIWLSWFVLEDQIYSRDPQRIEASPLSTILYSVVGLKAPLYLSNDVYTRNATQTSQCVPAQTLRNLIASAMAFYREFVQPFYVQSLVGSPAYNGIGFSNHSRQLVGADLQCGQAIYNDGIDCNKITDYCYKGFKQAVASPASIGCGETWWPVSSMHCAN